MRIRRVVLREIRLPMVEPFRISSGVEEERRILLVELIDEDGNPGWGECVAGALPNYLPETIDVAWLALEKWLAPRLVAGPLAGPEDVFARLEEGVRGYLMAKASLEMACWELDARRRGVSLAERLGGELRTVTTGISIGIQESPAALAEKVVASRGEGYRKIKVKIKPGADLEYAAAARDVLGPEAPLMVDANNAYTLEDVPIFRRLDRLALLMIEQPLAWDDRYLHAELQRQIETPICLDESISSAAHAAEMIALGSGRIVNIKPGRVGGFARSLEIHDLCRAQGIPMWCGGMLESGVGRAHNVALASLPGFTLPGDLSPSRRYWRRDIVTPEWTMDDDGEVRVPWDRPGMGVEVDRDRVDELTVRREVVDG